jgi:hypothetical protein
MNQEKKLLIPPRLLVLDLIGMHMVGLGLAKYFSNVDVILDQLRFENYGLVFIAVGFALTTPALLHIIGTIRAKSPRTEQ